MGEVWAAEDTHDGTAVAVKFGAGPSDGRQSVSGPTHEATVLRRIRHPHIVELVGKGCLAVSPFIVMELLRGRTLAAELALEGPLALDAAARTLTHVARALKHIHGRGIVHRDVKPQNVFVCRDDSGERVKLIDFGLAVDIQPGARAESERVMPDAAGSLAFISPEELLGVAYPGVQSDLWALAVTAYLMLTKRLPFRRRSSDVWRRCPSAWTFDLPSAHRADIPARTDAWFQRAFARDRSERFASAEHAAHAFRTAISDVGEEPARST